MATKRNVLQLIHGFIQGGSERQMIQQTRMLHESGRYRIHVACLSGGGVLRPEVDRLGLGEIPEYPLTSFYDRNMMIQLRRFAALLRERRIDVVHTHDFYSNIFGMAGAALARVKVRIASRRETGGMRTPAQKLVERTAYRLAHAVVANADAVRRQLADEGVNARKVVVVYNGLDIERLTPQSGLGPAEARALCGLPREGSRRFVTIVANLQHDVKDHPTFLRAAQRVRDAVPGASFVVAGEGRLTGSMRALSEQLGLENDVYFIGRCGHIAELLAASEVCVLSSKAEGFSNAILEYMAAGRPVVATAVGGAAEAVVEGETGHLVEPGDDAAMAARISALLRDPARAREMGACGRRVVEEKFSCAAQLERVDGLYEGLLAKAEVTRGVESVSHGRA